MNYLQGLTEIDDEIEACRNRRARVLHEADDLVLQARRARRQYIRNLRGQVIHLTGTSSVQVFNSSMAISQCEVHFEGTLFRVIRTRKLIGPGVGPRGNCDFFAISPNDLVYGFLLVNVTALDLVTASVSIPA